MRHSYSLLIFYLTVAVLSVNSVVAQTSPIITNVTNVADPTAEFPALAPGSGAVIVGTNLADSAVSAVPPMPLLGGVEVHLIGATGETVAGLVYVSPKAINFVVPSIANITDRTLRILIVKDGQRFDGLTTPGRVTIDALSIQSSPNPALSDQPVTITAHVTTTQGVLGSVFHASIGSVTFMDGKTPLATLSLSNVITYLDTPPLRRYDVSFTTSKLADGDHTIWASYSGDNSNPPATSGVITQSVETPEITIWTGPNPSRYGNTVTIVATISPSTCTGSIVFFDERDQLGIATIDRGRALIQTAALSVGNHPITVKYAGDNSCPALAYGPANDFTYRITSQTVVTP